MSRLYNKINLPTNTTDIKMFASYLNAIGEKGTVMQNEEQTLFADVKKTYSRKDVKAPKRDTHTKQTLNQFGLIDILDNGSFSVSSLGKEVQKFFDSPESHTEEQRTALMLKVFLRWEIDDSQYNRHMHPGYLIVKLLCDPDLEYYITNHELADFVMCEQFVSDDQFEEIKRRILDFRNGIGISKVIAQSKAGIFLASLVNNWKILTSSVVDLNADQKKLADQYFKQYLKTDDNPEEDELNEEELSEEENKDLGEPGTTLTDSQTNAFRAFHTVKKYCFTGIASYISHLFLYLQSGTRVKDYCHYFYKDGNTLAPEKSDSAIQIIYFGAPGTGKSYKIKHEILPANAEPYLVTFFSDYYYSDFVGGLRPKKGDNGIEYIFEPGPFAKALKDSFIKGTTYLIIEEINRGNAAAIFGDFFQLLDRKGGQSEYSITNHEIYEYLVKEGVQGLEEDKVFLPSTLNILCTMNTADQNVFVLDTAFKRRFKMEYVPINFKAYYETAEDGSEKVKDKCRGYLENVSIFEGQKFEKDLKIVMTDDIYKKVVKTIKEPKRDWPTFASYVNAKIDTINALEQKISEDKKLGPFFVDTDELLDIKAFVDKVIYYLKQDVFKYEDNILMDSYEALYDRFVNNKEDVFELFDHPKQK